MAKKKTEPKTVHRPADPNVLGLRGTVVEQPITRTLDENYICLLYTSDAADEL